VYRYRFLLLPSALILCIASCSGSGGVVKIGAAGPWQTGYGLMNKRGIELAAEEINASNELDGRRLQVVMRDDRGDGAAAVAVANRFLTDPAIVGIVGHVSSGAMVAAARIYNRGLPAVATSATSPDLTGISPWVFRLSASDSMNGAEMARFAAQLPHLRGDRRPRAAILYENDSYGRGLAEAFHRSFVGEIVSEDPVDDRGAQDFEPYITGLRRVGPDIVFVATTEAAGLGVLREARRQGLATPFLGGDGWTGVVADPRAAEGAYVGTTFNASDPRPEIQRFVTRFRAKYGVIPDGNAALAYDATMLLARAIAERGADRTRIREWLASLTDATAFSGVSGPVHFGHDGDPIGKEIMLTRVRGGALAVEPGAR
jgi:branched-chain amino acid transport system substrate-binding protein